jgi:hypothetical protein
VKPGRPASLAQRPDALVRLRTDAAIYDNQSRTSTTELREPCSLGTFF